MLSTTSHQAKLFWYFLQKSYFLFYSSAVYLYPAKMNLNYCYLQIKIFYYYNKIRTGYWWMAIYFMTSKSGFLFSNSLTTFFVFFFVDLLFMKSWVLEWIIMASEFLWNCGLIRSSPPTVVHLVCGLTFTFWSFEILPFAKRFITDSPMIKTCFFL